MSLAAAPAGGPVRRPGREGAQGPGFWVSSRPRGRGRTDHPGKLPGGSGATLNDLHRDAGEGWWSACPSPGFPLPQPLTRGSAPGCADCPFGTSWRGRAASTRSGTDAPFVVPKPAGGGIPQGPTDADVGTAPQADAARGWAAGGVGGGLSPPRGGTRSPAPARRPCPAAEAIGVRAGVAGVTPSWEGTPGLPCPRLHGGAGRAVTASPASIAAPPPGAAPSRPGAPPALGGSSGPTVRAGPAPVLQPRHRRPLAAGLGLCAHSAGPGHASRPGLRGSLGRELPSPPHSDPTSAPPALPLRSRPHKTPKEGVVCGSGPLKSPGGPSPAHRTFRWQRLDNP